MIDWFSADFQGTFVRFQGGFHVLKSGPSPPRNLLKGFVHGILSECQVRTTWPSQILLFLFHVSKPKLSKQSKSQPRTPYKAKGSSGSNNNWQQLTTTDNNNNNNTCCCCCYYINNKSYLPVVCLSTPAAPAFNVWPHQQTSIQKVLESQNSQCFSQVVKAPKNHVLVFQVGLYIWYKCMCKYNTIYYIPIISLFRLLYYTNYVHRSWI